MGGKILNVKVSFRFKDWKFKINDWNKKVSLRIKREKIVEKVINI